MAAIDPSGRSVDISVEAKVPLSISSGVLASYVMRFLDSPGSIKAISPGHGFKPGDLPESDDENMDRAAPRFVHVALPDGGIRVAATADLHSNEVRVATLEHTDVRDDPGRQPSLCSDLLCALLAVTAVHRPGVFRGTEAHLSTGPRVYSRRHRAALDRGW